MERFGGTCILMIFVQLTFAGSDHAVITITPDSFLSGVSQNVEITCVPPPDDNIAQVIMLQLYKKRRHDLYMDPVASYDTSDRPLVEAVGASLGFSASGSYNTSDPRSAALRVDIAHPTGAAHGRYLCRVETLDFLGYVERYEGSALLKSLARNGSVPGFYHSILQDLRRDLDILGLDLTNVTDVFHSVQNIDKEVDAKVSTLEHEGAKIQTLTDDVTSELQAVDLQMTSIRADITRLDRVTPDYPVNFYAYLTSSSIRLADGAVIVFDSSPQHTDDSYSTSKGVFTAPANGTYRFVAAIRGHVNIKTVAFITVNGQVVASLFAFDDYHHSQATAHVVVQLAAGNEVKVVKKTGSLIYGQDLVNHLSYFTGMLLW